MEARITFRSEVFIKGKNLEEIKDKWEELPLYSGEALEDANIGFLELVSVEDAETYKDIIKEFE